MWNEPSWASVGINGETGFIQLLFDPFSTTLIAHFFRELKDGYHVKSLYARHTSEDRYHRITEETDKLSFESPVLSPRSSHLYVNVMETSQFEGKYHGYNWHSLRMIDITSNEVVSIMENEDFPVNEPYHEGWVSEIHGAAADGEAIYCSIALQRKTGGQSAIVDYHLAKLDLGGNKYEIITKLNNVFL